MIGGLYRVTKDVPPYTLASGEPLRLAGLNVVGLRRAGFSSEVRRALRAFYRKLYRRDRLFSESLKEALAERDATITMFVTIIGTNSINRKSLAATTSFVVVQSIFKVL